MKLLAQLISFLTNPIFVILPVPYLLVFRFGYGHSLALKWTLFSLAFLLIAVIFVLYEVKNKVFSDMDVSKREQRPLLFSAMGFIALIYFFSLFILHAPPILFITVWGIMAGVFMASLINRRIKASMHIAALTVVLLSILKLYSLSYALFLLIPIVGWSRIKIKRHTLAEVFSGFFLGAALTILMYILLKYINILPV
jgi:hypothetical protein